MERDIRYNWQTGEMTIGVGQQCVSHGTLWVDTADKRVYSIRQEISTTEDTITIRTTTTPVPVNAIDAGEPVIKTVTMTRREYFKRKLAGEFGDL